MLSKEDASRNRSFSILFKALKKSNQNLTIIKYVGWRQGVERGSGGGKKSLSFKNKQKGLGLHNEMFVTR